tara:strand:- start:802 stop:975 length:174 start_codon:yes stop_codon:yes gene_type:complete
MSIEKATLEAQLDVYINMEQRLRKALDIADHNYQYALKLRIEIERRLLEMKYDEHTN